MSLEAGEKPGWFTLLMRLASVAAIVALLAGVGIAVRKGDTFTAGMLVFAVAGLGALFSWSWTGSIFTSLARAKRYVEGVEGNRRHEWYAFKGMRVRVFLDEQKRPWFPLKEIAFILGLEADEETFRHYRQNEIGIPESASEKCLSEAGLRRLVKYSKHPDAGALGLWLDREVLRMLKNRKEAGIL